MLQVQVGTLVRGRYELRRLIGEGGFGTVWEAIDLTTSQRVALKALKTFNVSALRRFDIECEALTRLNHPHCLRVLDSGRWEEGEPFLVTEFVEGETLRTWAATTPPMAERVEVGRQVATALAHAHRSGVLHRDLKPENILIANTPGGPVAKVLDFGLAKLTGLERPDVTKTGEVFGTPGYMSPEQLRGVTRPTPATDVYSLGVVMFELFQGRAPFRGDTNLDTAMQHLVDTAPRLAGAAPSDVIELVGKMLSKEPEARPQMHAVAQRLSGEDRVVLEAAERPDSGGVAILAVAIVGALAVLIAVLVAAGVFSSPEPVPPASRSTSVLTKTPPRPAVADMGVLDAAIATAPDLPTVENGSAGCGLPPLEETFYLRRDGKSEHEIYLQLPPNYDPRVPAPLLVLFHDVLQAAPMVMDLKSLVDPALERGFVVIAVADDVRENTWLDESDYTEAIDSIEWVREQLCIDVERTFLFGHGNGGWGATTVACRTPVRAVATTAHRLWANKDGCKAADPPPMIIVSMMQDPFSPADGGSGCIVETVSKSVKEHEAQYRGIHGCRRGDRETHVSDDGNCWTTKCEVPLEWCRAEGARSWPGMPVREFALNLGQMICGGGERPADFDFGGQIWRFFDAQDGAEP